MPSRRPEIALSEEDQRRFLEEAKTLQVASNGRDGHAHLVAMWYVVIDGLVHFTTFAKSQKVRNLRRDPRMTIMVEAGLAYSELRGLVIKGRAEVIDDIELVARVMTLVGAKQSGRPAPASITEGARRQAAKRVAVRVHPVDEYSWDHSKLAGRY